MDTGTMEPTVSFITWFLNVRLHDAKEAPCLFLVGVGSRGAEKYSRDPISDLGSQPWAPGGETIQGLKLQPFLKHTLRLSPFPQERSLGDPSQAGGKTTDPI